MRPTINITGKKFNLLTAIRLDHKEGSGRKIKHFWLFKCDCGKEKVLPKSPVVRGVIRSCGCLHKKRVQKHGLSQTDLYHSIWVGIKQRCYNNNSKDFQRYGGSGINMCEEWKNDFESFYNWAMNNGYKKGLTIDRIDNSKGYSPENCRWVTPKEQANNKRTCVYVTYKGETKTVSEFCRKFGLKTSTVYNRIKRKGINYEGLFKKSSDFSCSGTPV